MERMRRPLAEVGQAAAGHAESKGGTTMSYTYTKIDPCATSSIPYSDGSCPHCGMMHKTTCPRIKAIEYGPDGRVRRIEFHEQRTVQPVGTLFEAFAGLPDKHQHTDRRWG